MSDDVVRIAMWSGPRNISTAMMRSFGQRPDTEVVDEPFYAAFLTATGIDHPLRDQTLAGMSSDWGEIAAAMSRAGRQNKPIFYQKQMCHHMVEGSDLGFMAACRNAFLIRPPAAVLASYIRSRAEVTINDIGVFRQWEMFQDEFDRLGRPPPVLDGDDLRTDPPAYLRALCESLGVPYMDAMLSWPPGPRPTDGAWAPAWYASVESSRSFAERSRADPAPLPPAVQDIADQAQPIYEQMAAWKLRPETPRNPPLS